MKKRLFVLLAALAAMAAIVAGSALASNPGGGTTTCNSDWTNTKGWVTVPNNLDVPAGTTCKFSGEVKGNVTVEGDLRAFGATFDNQVSVNGGQYQSANYGSWIHGNLSITNSQGNYGAGDQNGFWNEYADTHVDGNVTLTGNQIPLYIQGPYHTLVKGSVNVISGAGLVGDSPVQHATY
jgi:hypothetical protein